MSSSDWNFTTRCALAAGIACAAGLSVLGCDPIQDWFAGREPDSLHTGAGSGQRSEVGAGKPELRDVVIEDLVVGAGRACEGPTQIVTIHYRGTLLDGQEFDSSYARGEPIVAPLDSLIAGWQQGVPGMKVGGRRRLTIPASLSYSGMAAVETGDTGLLPRKGTLLIPPGSTLVFEIELLDASPLGATGDRADLARREGK